MVIIRKIRTTRYLGVAAAARSLGVSPQAISRFVRGNKYAISKAKALKIRIR